MTNLDLSHLETLVRELNAEETSVFRKRALIIALADECAARLPALLSTLREQRKALEAIRAEIGPTKAYAESYGLEGGKLPSAVHIKLDMIDGYARTALEGEGL